MKWNKFLKDFQYQLLHNSDMNIKTAHQILELIQNYMSAPEKKRYSNLIDTSLNMTMKQINLIEVNKMLEIQRLELDFNKIKGKGKKKNE